jgi:hypothetical protein
MTTIHSYTNDQQLLDLPHTGKSEFWAIPPKGGDFRILICHTAPHTNGAINHSFSGDFVHPRDRR